MQKRIVWVLIAALMLGLTTTAMAAELGSQPVSIVLWHSMSEDAGVLMEKFVSDFNETVGKELNITVESVFQGKYSDATAKMNSILTAEDYNSLPDVMQIDATGKIAYATSGVAYTIDDVLASGIEYDLSQIMTSPLLTWKYAGVQLGLPFSASTTVMYYNKTMLDQAGAKVPETFADIAALAALLPKTTADGQPIYALATQPNTPTLGNWLGQMGSYVVNNANGTGGSATALDCIDNGALETFLTEWKAMYDAGALLNQSSGTTDMFVAGQLALLPTSSSNTASLLGKIGDSFELGIAYYPKVNAEASFGATISGAGVFMFNKGDELKKAAAWELMKYLTSAEVQAEFSVGTGYLPVNTGSVDTEVYQAMIAKTPMAAVTMDQVAATPAEMQSVTVGPSIDFYYAITDNISAMLDNNMSAQETLQILKEELTLLLDDYNRANP